MLSSDEMQKQHRMAVEAARDRFKTVVGDHAGQAVTVGKHEAMNYVHLKTVIAEADELCPRAADTLRWFLWHDVLEAQRMASMAGATDV